MYNPFNRGVRVAPKLKHMQRNLSQERDFRVSAFVYLTWEEKNLRIASKYLHKSREDQFANSSWNWEGFLSMVIAMSAGHPSYKDEGARTMWPRGTVEMHHRFPSRTGSSTEEQLMAFLTPKFQICPGQIHQWSPRCKSPILVDQSGTFIPLITVSSLNLLLLDM